jgi:hypothetical protein
VLYECGFKRYYLGCITQLYCISARFGLRPIRLRLCVAIQMTQVAATTVSEHFAVKNSMRLVKKFSSLPVPNVNRRMHSRMTPFPISCT